MTGEEVVAVEVRPDGSIGRPQPAPDDSRNEQIR